MKLKYFLVLLFLVGLHTVSYCQIQYTNEAKISGSFPGIDFEWFVRQIEAATPYRFYFKPEELSQVSVSVSATNNNMEQILAVVFEGTDLKFEIDDTKRVFITKGKPLGAVLPWNYFQRTNIDELENAEERLADTDRTFSRNKLYVVGAASGKESATLRGRIVGLESGAPISGATLFEKTTGSRSITNDRGEYQLRLPVGRYSLLIQNLGGYTEQRQISLLGDGTLDFQIEENVISLDEVVIMSDNMSNVKRAEMGVQKLNMTTMKKLPAALGEVDVLRSILTLPGVQTVGEASVGFNVRGGAADQNLILFNQSTIYNPSHLFGMFSAFNPDLVESVDLYKAGVPVKYGGRLSSVLNVNAKYGNNERIQVKGGIGLLTGRITVDGPIGKNTTFIVGGRSTYSSWLIDLLEERTILDGTAASFYDLNLNVSHKIDDKNVVKLNTYSSKDAFRFDRDTTFRYENQSVNVNWTHYFNDQLEMELTLGRDNYAFEIEGRDNVSNAYDFGFGIKQNFAKVGASFKLNERHSLEAGASSIDYFLSPGFITPSGAESIVVPEEVSAERAREVAIYVGDNFTINDKLSVNYGVRYTFFSYLGPNTARYYQPGVSYAPTTLTDERTFAKGEGIANYGGPEFRISSRYAIDNISSIKAGYNTNRQYIHLMTNNAAVAPTDIWKLSDNNIRPQWGDQLSVGYYRNLNIDKYEFSVETYYRNMKNLVDFRSGAVLILNDAIEQSILRTQGKAYGAETMLKKPNGRLNGWVMYTYSRSLLRTYDTETAELINDGKWYPNNFDQPHNATVVGNFEWSKRFSTSLNATYSTGRPITLPIAKFEYGGSERVFFSDRNAYRIPDYFRIDLSCNIEGNHKVQKLGHSSWSVGIYNLLGRRNPYSVYFTPVQGVLQGYRLSIFANPIPFVTYNFRI